MTLRPDLLAAIETYFDAIHHCDTEKLNAVFHPQSASKGQPREAEVLMIDHLSPISATVKIRIRAHQSVFVDHLGFVLGVDGWQIVSKIWHLEDTIDPA